MKNSQSKSRHKRTVLLITLNVACIGLLVLESFDTASNYWLLGFTQVLLISVLLKHLITPALISLKLEETSIEITSMKWINQIQDVSIPMISMLDLEFDKGKLAFINEHLGTRVRRSFDYSAAPWNPINSSLHALHHHIEQRHVKPNTKRFNWRRWISFEQLVLILFLVPLVWKWPFQSSSTSLILIILIGWAVSLLFEKAKSQLVDIEFHADHFILKRHSIFGDENVRIMNERLDDITSDSSGSEIVIYLAGSAAPYSVKCAIKKKPWDDLMTKLSRLNDMVDEKETTEEKASVRI
ncbi:MAG: hypothetical protein HWD92_03980 [Flavobacteriia bacterium]|nr:hypothetical protein [Flavobacteriia bacterium]